MVQTAIHAGFYCTLWSDEQSNIKITAFLCSLSVMHSLSSPFFTPITIIINTFHRRRRRFEVHS